MVPKKRFRYFAININNTTVIFRRTVGKLSKIRSVLYKPGSDFTLTQVTITGGKVVGSMPYQTWRRHKAPLTLLKPLLLSREEYRALDPYISR